MWESRAFVYLHFRSEMRGYQRAFIRQTDGIRKESTSREHLTSSFSPGRQRQSRPRVHPPGYRSSGTAGKSSTIIHRPRNTVLPSPMLSLIHSKNTCSLSEFSEQSCQPSSTNDVGGAEFKSSKFDRRRTSGETSSNSGQIARLNLKYIRSKI